MIDEGDWREGCIKKEEIMVSRREGRWWNYAWSMCDVCVPVGPMCLRGLVLAGWQGRSVLVCMRVCVRVRIGGWVGGAGGALWGRIVGVGGWGATVVQTVELIHLLIRRLWTKRDTDWQKETQTGLFYQNPLFSDSSLIWRLRSCCHCWGKKRILSHQKPTLFFLGCVVSVNWSWGNQASRETFDRGLGLFNLAGSRNKEVEVDWLHNTCLPL